MTGMNEVIERILVTGEVEDEAGNRYAVRGSSIPRATGEILYEAVRTLAPERTIETGMAYGVSTLFLCQALEDGGRGRHTAIDPYQHRAYHGIGVTNVARAGLSARLDFHEASSDEVLPRLRDAGERFQFAFIDGNHRFDYTLLDFFFIDRMLDIGGMVAVDDLWIPAVRKAISYILRNNAYERLTPSRPAPPLRRRLLRAGRRIVQNPVARDWSLKLIPENVVLLRKRSDEREGWNRHRDF